MKKADITQLTTGELVEKIAEEQLALSKMKLNHTVAPLENPMAIRNARKIIARLKTELRKREIAA